MVTFDFIGMLERRIPQANADTNYRTKEYGHLKPIQILGGVNLIN